MKKEYPIKAVPRNGNTIIFAHQEQIWLDLSGISFNMERGIAYVHDLQIVGATTNGDIANIFINEALKSLPVKGRDVIDIGANIADSSLYFITQGAKKVYAIEPNIELYDLAKQNIDINKLSGQVSLVWAGCSSTTSKTNKPPFLSLQDIINQYDISADVLKVDCEGCEYDIILNASDDLIRSFSYILVEYHHGYKNIKQKLKRCGFEIKVSRPTYHSTVQKPNNLGILFSEGSNTRHYNTYYMGYIIAKNQRAFT